MGNFLPFAFIFFQKSQSPKEKQKGNELATG
jgi:hypothetical protein